MDPFTDTMSKSDMYRKVQRNVEVIFAQQILITLFSLSNEFRLSNEKVQVGNVQGVIRKKFPLQKPRWEKLN